MKPSEDFHPRCPKCKGKGLKFETPWAGDHPSAMVCMDCRHVEPVRDVADFAQFFIGAPRRVLLYQISWNERSGEPRGLSHMEWEALLREGKAVKEIRYINPSTGQMDGTIEAKYWRI